MFRNSGYINHVNPLVEVLIRQMGLFYQNETHVYYNVEMHRRRYTSKKTFTTFYEAIVYMYEHGVKKSDMKKVRMKAHGKDTLMEMLEKYIEDPMVK